MDEVNDARLLTIAAERFAHYDPANVITEEEMDKQLGITEAEKDLKNLDGIQQIRFLKNQGSFCRIA